MQRAVVQLAHAATTPLAVGDTNGDRLLDPLEMLKIGDPTYVALLADIRGANVEVKKLAEANPNIESFTIRIDNAIKDIDQQPGSNEAERVKMYVAKQLGAPQL
jgi:hypothetical protein